MLNRDRFPYARSEVTKVCTTRMGTPIYEQVQQFRVELCVQREESSLLYLEHLLQGHMRLKECMRLRECKHRFGDKKEGGQYFIEDRKKNLLHQWVMQDDASNHLCEMERLLKG